MTKDCIVLDFAGDGYREGVYAILKPFAKAPHETCAVSNSESGRTMVSNANLTFNTGQPSSELLGRVGRLANMATSCMLAAVEVPTRAVVARNGTHQLAANVASLPLRETARLTSPLNEFDKLFTTQPGFTKPPLHSIGTRNILLCKVTLEPLDSLKRRLPTPA